MNAVEIQKAAAGARGEQARTLRSQGLLLREIAAELGVARTTVGQYLADPDGARLKARRDGYRGRCECGSPTHGTNGPGKAPTRCIKCTSESRHESRYWTAERVVSELQAWARELRRAPGAREAATRGAPVPLGMVQRESGSWNNGLAAAGLPTITRRAKA